MANQFIKLNKGTLRKSVKDVMNNMTDAIREVRNKTPDIVANKILALSNATVPIYTSTLKRSGHIEHIGEGATIVYDATVEEQRQAQEQKFGHFGNSRIYINIGQKPDDSYAELVNARTQFLDKAIDLFNKGEPITIPVTKDIGGTKRTITSKLDLEIGKYGYISREDVILAKRKARARVSYNIRKKRLENQMKPYIETYGEKEAHKMFFEEEAYLNRRKREYKRKYKKIYGVRSK